MCKPANAERERKKQMKKITFVLASSSPRRRELIKRIEKNTLFVTPKNSENIAESNPIILAERLARAKSCEAAKDYPNHLVIGCDTVVSMQGEIFGKPKSEDHAKQMLCKLSGKTHEVITGVCLKSREAIVSFSETTKVTFYSLTQTEIDAYLQEGDWTDKAGGYGIQSKGAFLVKKIEGDYYNVMGLPLAKLYREIRLFLKNN